MLQFFPAHNIEEHLFAWVKPPCCSQGAVCALSHLAAVVSVACRGRALFSRFEKEKAVYEMEKAGLTHLNLALPTSDHGNCPVCLMFGDLTRALPPSARGECDSFCGHRTHLH